MGYYGTDFSQFGENKRGYFIVDTGKWGHAALIVVGLDTISSIKFNKKFSNIKNPAPIKRGNELENFFYGGSLFIMIFEKDPYGSGAIQVWPGNQVGVFDTSSNKAR